MQRRAGGGGVCSDRFCVAIKPGPLCCGFWTQEAEGCTVTATLVDKWLVVADDRQCGGMNVSFDGIYRNH